MSRFAVRLVTAALVAGSAAIGFVPLAQAATESTLTPSKEAWYQPNPTCAQATGCLPPALPAELPVVPPSPYPAGTLHVGWSAGQETARTYLVLPVADVLGDLVSATLDVPLDVATESGSQSPETAQLQACLFSDDVAAVEGSMAPPPPVSCDATAPVSYVATPTPHLHADLAPLVGGLLTTGGIALLPDPTKAAQTDAWRVVFSAHTRTDAAKTPPASVQLTLADEVVDSTPPVTLPGEEGAGFGGVAPPVGTGFAPVPSGEQPAAPPVTTVPPTTAGPPVVTLPRTVTVGYAYPTVWLLPLAFLVLVPATARALTKDLAPA